RITIVERIHAAADGALDSGRDAEIRVRDESGDDVGRILAPFRVPAVEKLALRMSVRRSPKMLSDRMVSTMAKPGSAERNHSVRNCVRPLPMRLPQLTTLGFPRLRNDTADSSRMPFATSTEAATMRV